MREGSEGQQAEVGPDATDGGCSDVRTWFRSTMISRDASSSGLFLTALTNP